MPARPARSRSVSGAMWSSAGVGTQAIGQFVVLAVLARLLAPADFGVVTASMILVGFARLATTEGLVGPALTQRRELGNEHIRAAFLMSLGTGVAAAAAMWAIAPLAAEFFKMGAVAEVTRALAVTLVLQSSASVPLALLLRDLRFKSVAAVDVVSYVVGFAIVGCLAAAAGAGVWALVGAYVGQALVQTMLLNAVRRYPVSLRAPRSAFRDLWVFGSGHTLARYLNYAALQGDFIVVGRYLSEAALGLYGRAYQLASAPALLAGGVLDKVLFPTLAARQSDLSRLKRDYVRAISLCVSLTAPVSVLVVVLAPEIVEVVLGKRWSGVVLPMQILAVTLIFRTGYKVSDSLSKATGVVFQRAARQAVYAAAVIGGAYAAQSRGISAVALAVSCAIALNYALMATLSLRVTGLGWTEFARAHGRGLLFALLATLGSLAGAVTARSAGLPALLVVVLGTLAVAVVVVGAVAISPRRMLGADLVWFLGQVARRRHRLAAGVDG